MASHRGGHAQARIGVDVGAAHIAFHELVGHVVIFGQTLARDIKRHAVGAMFCNGLGKAFGHLIQSGIPCGGCAIDVRLKQAPIHADGFAQSRTFGAQRPEIGRVAGIAAHGDFIIEQAFANFHAAAHPAIGAGGFGATLGRGFEHG